MWCYAGLGSLLLLRAAGEVSGNLVASLLGICLASDQGTVAACHGRASLIYLVKLALTTLKTCCIRNWKENFLPCSPGLEKYYSHCEFCINQRLQCHVYRTHT